MAKDYVHVARRTWWSGRIVTRCGLTLSADSKQENRWFTSGPMCPACKAAK